MASDGGQTEIRSWVEAQETERARIARELHDGLGQKVALLQMDLDRVARALPANEHQTQVHALSAQVSDIARELHDVSYELHPLRLEILGLAKSIEALCEESARQSGIAITFSCDAALARQIGSRERLCLYRVAQEALHNVVKHSNATRACVELLRLHGALGLVVADLGQGFDNSVATTGLGLTSMRQRVHLLHGAIDVYTCKGGGTCICVRIPCRHVATTNPMWLSTLVSLLRRHSPVERVYIRSKFLAPRTWLSGAIRSRMRVAMPRPAAVHRPSDFDRVQ